MNPRRYFDHAATGWPLDPAVPAAMLRHLESAGGNPGRGAHRLAVAAAARIAATREAMAALLGRGNPERVVFTASATEAIQLALGVVEPGDEVVTSSIEHNAVARPLARLADEAGVVLRTALATPEGLIEPEALAALCSPRTRLVAVTAASNVLGARTDLAALRPAIGPAPLLFVDAAQVAGLYPIDMDAWGLDMVAVPGHKAIGGPQGTGALAVSDRVDLPVLREGGIGGRSEDRRTPRVFPDGYEAGTPNGPGLAGLSAALALRPPAAMAREAARLAPLRRRLVEGLQALPGARVFGCLDERRAVPLASFRLDGRDCAELAWRLGEAGFAVRAGLHCAPAAHRTAGSIDGGLVRIALGAAHDEEAVDDLLAAIADIAGRAA